jgi:hypothetical protein
VQNLHALLAANIALDDSFQGNECRHHAYPHNRSPSRAGALAGKIYGDRNGWQPFHVERSMSGDERSNLNL